MGDVRYDRRVLVDVLVYHQRRDAQYCACGWGDLGASHAEHVATVYEQTMAAALTPYCPRLFCTLPRGHAGRCPAYPNDPPLEGQEVGEDPSRVRSEWGSGREGTDDGGQDGG